MNNCLSISEFIRISVLDHENDVGVAIGRARLADATAGWIMGSGTNQVPSSFDNNYYELEFIDRYGVIICQYCRSKNNRNSLECDKCGAPL